MKTFKRYQFVALMLIAVLTAFLAGCNGVTLNSKYSALVDQTAALASETDARWDTLTPAQQKQAFHGNAQIWQQFKAAKDGKEVTTTP